MNYNSRKKFKAKNPNKNKKKEVIMAYYCKLCQCWHYPGTKIYYIHRVHASQRHTPKNIVKRRRKSFWDRF